jgi:hypothetical protein
VKAFRAFRPPAFLGIDFDIAETVHCRLATFANQTDAEILETARYATMKMPLGMTKDYHMITIQNGGRDVDFLDELPIYLNIEGIRSPVAISHDDRSA